MKKTILFGLMAICLFSMGSALTQQQIDALDMDTINLNYNWNRWLVQDGMISRSIQFDFIGWGNVTDIPIVRLERNLMIEELNFWKWCKSNYDLADCRMYIQIKSNHVKYKFDLQLRETLKLKQTQVQSDISDIE